MPGGPTRIADLWLSRARKDDASAAAARQAVAQLKPAVVVTGGSRGIGRAIAQHFASHGHHVAIVARTDDDLKNSAIEIERHTGQRVLPIACDLTSPKAFAIISQDLERAGYFLDVLVNNAGLGLAGPFVEQDETDIAQLVELNILVLTSLSRHALPAMLARRRGGLLNVASLGAYVPGPHQAAYYASKAYVVSLTEAMAAENYGSGVRFCVLAPGPVETGFHAKMGADTARYRRIIPALSPDAVARAAYRGYYFGLRVVAPGWLGPISHAALKILPHPISVPLMTWLLKRDAE
jgi:short-subunit dehydrogenase